MAYRPRVLVVEDDPASQDMLVRRLAARGFRMASLSDGESCLRYVSRASDAERPDLVLLDINLPGMSGLDVVTALRKNSTRDGLPIILVSALADSEDVVRGLNAGANDYVVKPINFAVLLARVQVALQIKLDVSLLIEAERQRVLIQSIGEACHQLAQPMTAVTFTLEALIHHPPADPQEVSEQLREILKWTEEVGAVIHRMQSVATFRPVPYTQRMDFFGGTPTAPVNTAAPELDAGAPEV